VANERAGGAAFLLAQIGAHAAGRFGERLAEHRLSPPQAGILRLVAARSGMSQQELADTLGMLPSRVVAFVDELEADGLVQRVRDTGDRRRNALQLTQHGRSTLQVIGRVAKAHEDAICAALSERERSQLRTLLSKIAEEQGLTPGVHPGYRSLGPSSSRARS
jgi:DNA-binding MarR family transcriptional regulator